MILADWRVTAAPYGLACALLGSMLAGCGVTNPIIPGGLGVKTGSAAAANAPVPTQRLSTTIEQSPPAPAAERTSAGASGESVLADLPSSPANIYLNFDQVPLPALIQALYADLLKKNVNIDPAVASRRDRLAMIRAACAEKAAGPLASVDIGVVGASRHAASATAASAMMTLKRCVRIIR